MASYEIASEEGAQRYGGEVGDSVDLTLNADEKRAVIAAGWLVEENPKKKEEAK